MHLISFIRAGRPGFGCLQDRGIIDLSALLGGRFADLRAVLSADALPLLAETAAGRKPDFAAADVTFLPVIANPGKIMCIGLNYAAHAAETKRPVAPHPTVFTRFADCQIGHGQALVIPKVSNCLDWEGEMAVIIGRGGRYIAPEAALSHIAGYSIYNDASVRDWQRHTSQFTPGKNFSATGAFGPALVTADEIPDYTELRLTTKVNGEVRQQGHLADLIYSVPQLIAYCSSFTPLCPGDVIVTGTPAGVGEQRHPPLYLHAGDLVEIEIPGLGKLGNPVIKEM